MPSSNRSCPFTPFYVCVGGRVTEIDLDAGAMPTTPGTVSSSLGQLDALTSLTIQGFVNLTGTLPPMASLTKLRLLNLLGADLTGALPIEQLTALTFVRLGGNAFRSVRHAAVVAL